MPPLPLKLLAFFAQTPPSFLSSFHFIIPISCVYLRIFLCVHKSSVAFKNGPIQYTHIARAVHYLEIINSHLHFHSSWIYNHRLWSRKRMCPALHTVACTCLCAIVGTWIMRRDYRTEPGSFIPGDAYISMDHSVEEDSPRCRIMWGATEKRTKIWVDGETGQPWTYPHQPYRKVLIKSSIKLETTQRRDRCI